MEIGITRRCINAFSLSLIFKSLSCITDIAILWIGKTEYRLFLDHAYGFLAVGKPDKLNLKVIPNGCFTDRNAKLDLINLFIGYAD